MDDKLMIELLERLTRIESKLETVEQKILLIDDFQKDITEEKVRHEQIEKRLAELEDKHKWLARAVAGATITAIVGLVFALLKTAIGI